MSHSQPIAIIGGGAAGMAAALAVSRQHGAAAVIIERNPRIGKKLLATGNGRCNFTNINADPSHYHGHNPKFAYAALTRFSSQNTIELFTELGIAAKTEDAGKVFPMSDQASSVLDVLRYALDRHNVKLICGTCISAIQPTRQGFTLQAANGHTFSAGRVILAAGGQAMPASGSDGSGFALAAQLGHTITATFPGLVQLKLAGPYFKQLDGIKFVGTATLLHDKKALTSDTGDILFTNYGISGPPILQLSRCANALLAQHQPAMLRISILNGFSREAVEALIDRRIATSPEKSAQFSFVGMINKRLIPVILKSAGLSDINKPAGSLTSRERTAIASLLTCWEFAITGSRSWPSAQITAGGIDTTEIDPRSFESKLCPGLFFAGEIIDIDGECGGYNLQWAWSSGIIAGTCAAKYP